MRGQLRPFSGHKADTEVSHQWREGGYIQTAVGKAPGIGIMLAHRGTDQWVEVI